MKNLYSVKDRGGNGLGAMIKLRLVPQGLVTRQIVKMVGNTTDFSEIKGRSRK